MLVSLALFIIVMMVSVGTLLTLVDANRKAQAVASVTNNIHFALDTMSRALSTGSDYYCSTGTPSTSWVAGAERQNCTADADNQWLGFSDDDGDTVIYYKTGTALWRIKDGLAQQLTAPEVTVNDIGFVVTGAKRKSEASGDNVQPTVTIMIRATAGFDTETDSTYNLQTTVTQRILDL